MLGGGAVTFGVRARTPKHPLGLSLLLPYRSKLFIFDMWFIPKLYVYDKSIDKHHGSFMLLLVFEELLGQKILGLRLK